MKVKEKLQIFYQLMPEVIARYQGGDNAGHSIVIDGKNLSYAILLKFSSQKISVIGNGMVVNPKSRMKELSYLHEEGVTTDNLHVLMFYVHFISYRVRSLARS